MRYEKIMTQLKSFNFTNAQRKKLASIILKLDKEKQDILVSGDNIATINGQSLLNGGNISLIKTGIFSIVTELPTNDIDKDKVYLVSSTETDNENKFSEYIYTDNGWEKLGTFTAEIDLSNYVQKTDVVTDTTNGLMLASDKTKLDAFEEAGQYAKAIELPQYVAGKNNNDNFGIVVTDHMSDCYSMNFILRNLKGDGYMPEGHYIESATSTKAGVMSAQDKVKLDGIEAGAQVNKIESVSVNGTPLEITNKGVNIPNATIEQDGMMSKADKAKLDSQPTIKASDATGVTDNNYVVIKKSELDSILSRLSALENKA